MMALNHHDPNLGSHSRPVTGEPEIDLLTLYIRNIPLSFTSDELAALLSQGRRNIVLVNLLESPGGYSCQTGFVRFEHEDDAAGAMVAFNAKPPYYLQIKFANLTRRRNKNSNDDLENECLPQNGSLPNGLGHKRNASNKQGGRMKTSTLDIETLKITLDQGSRHSFISSNFPALTVNKYYVCQLCKSPAPLACSVCEKPYCSQNCQKRDWSSHKPACKSVVSTTFHGMNGIQEENVKASEANITPVEHHSQPSPHERSDLNQSLVEPPSRNGRLPSDSGHVPHNDIQPEDQRSLNHSLAEPPSRSERLPSDTRHVPYQDQRSSNQSLAEPPSQSERLPSDTGHVPYQDRQQGDQRSLNQSLAEPTSCNERLPSDTRHVPYQDRQQGDRRSFNAPSNVDRSSAEPSHQNGRLSPRTGRSQVEKFSDAASNQDRQPRFDRNSEKSFNRKPSTVGSHADDEHQANNEYPKKFNGRGREQNRDRPNPERKLLPKREFVVDTDINPIILNKKVIEKVSVCHIINPSKFYVHLESARRVIEEIQEKMQQSVERKPLKYVFKSSVYCTDARGQLERIKIVETRDERSLAYFYETGATECINSNEIYYFPPMFKEYSAQAISCTYGEDIKSSETDWSENEIQIFKKGAADKLFTMNIQLYQNATYTVSLVNELGIPLHAMLQKSQGGSSNSLPSQSILNEILESESLGMEVPSILKSLKVGSNTQFSPQFEEGGRIWGLLDDGSLTETAATINNELLQTKEEITMRCEIGDIGVALSVNYQTYYRCKILKRLKEKIEVFYLEYGNIEQVDKVFLASPVLLSAKCYLFTCTLPSEVKANIFNSKAVIKSIRNNLVELTFDTISIQLQPWDDYLSTQHSAKVGQNVARVVAKSPEKPKLAKQIEVQKHCHISSLQKSTIPVGEATHVKQLYFEAEVLFVCLASLEADLVKLASELQRADSFDSLAALPGVGDVVCAKYSDGVYYRANVKAICDNRTCLVSFVDFGNDDKVSLGSMKVLPQALCSYPIFAIPIKVNDIASVIKMENFTVENVGGSNSGILNCRLVERHMLSSLKRTYLPADKEIEVAYVHQENGLTFVQEISNLDNIFNFSVELQKFCKTSRLVQEPHVNELVCAKSSFDDMWYRGCVEKKASPTTFSIRFIDYGNMEDVPREKMSSISKDFLKDACFAIPVQVISDSSERVMLELNQKHTVIARGQPVDGVQKVKLVGQEKQVAKPPEQMPKASGTCDATEYFIQDLPVLPLEAGEQKIKILNVENFNTVAITPDGENVNANLQLASEVTNFCKSPESSKFNDDALLKAGQLVLAEFAGDFYRACVVDGPNREKLYEVVFFDFGNIEKLTIDKLRKMESRFMSLPAQSSDGRLIGFQAKENKADEIKRELDSFVYPLYGGELLGRVYKSDDDDVSLEIPYITEFLLKKNLVIRTST